MSREIETSLKRTTARRIVVEGSIQGENGQDGYGLVMATEWPNGEGFDISVGDKPILSIHDSELPLLKLAVDALEVDANTQGANDLYKE